MMNIGVETNKKTNKDDIQSMHENPFIVTNKITYFRGSFMRLDNIT